MNATQQWASVAKPSQFFSVAPVYSRMLTLPNGHVLFSDEDSLLYDYPPDGTTLGSGYQPVISSITHVSGSAYSLTGCRLNGISEGAGFGDDAEMSSNYPIVKFVNGSNVYY